MDDLQITPQSDDSEEPKKKKETPESAETPAEVTETKPVADPAVAAEEATENKPPTIKLDDTEDSSESPTEENPLAGLIAPDIKNGETPKGEAATDEKKPEEAPEEPEEEEPAEEEEPEEEPAEEEEPEEEPAEEEEPEEEEVPEAEESAEAEEPAKAEEPEEEEPAGEEEPKKGLPKAVLYGGITVVIVLLGVGAYFGRGLIFKDEVAAPETEVKSAAEEFKTKCAVDEYFDTYADETEEPITTFDPELCQAIPQDDCEIVTTIIDNPDAYFLDSETLANLEEWSASCDGEFLVATVTDSKCGDNQQLIGGQCQCSPGYFDISSIVSGESELSTETSLEDELQPALLAVDETEELVAEPTLLTLDETVEEDTEAIEKTAVDLTKDLAPGADKVCVDCAGLQVQIEEKKDQLSVIVAGLTNVTETNGEKIRLEAEIEDLEKIEKEQDCKKLEVCGPGQIRNAQGRCQCVDPLYKMDYRGVCVADCENKILPQLAVLRAGERQLSDDDRIRLDELEKIADDYQCDIIEESKTSCEKIEDSAMDLLDRGDVKGSYDEQFNLVQEDCARQFTECEEKLAYVLIAREYAAVAGEITPDDVQYYEAQVKLFKDSYYLNVSCVDLELLCANPKGGQEEEPVISLLTDEDTPLSLITGEQEEVSGLLTVGSVEAEREMSVGGILSQERLDENIDLFVESKGFYEDEDLKYFLETYCGRDVVMPSTTITPDIDVDIIEIEEPEEEKAPAQQGVRRVP